MQNSILPHKGVYPPFIECVTMSLNLIPLTPLPLRLLTYKDLIARYQSL